MRSIIKKSPIPESRSFMVQHLHSPYFDPNIHYHSEYQLFYVLEGRGNRFIGDNIKPFKEGDIVFTGPNLPHLWRSDLAYFDKSKGLQTSGIVLYMREDFLGESIHQKEELESLSHLFKRSLNGLEITGETNMCIRKMMVDILNMKGLTSIIQLLKILHQMADAADDCQMITHASYQDYTYNEKEKNRMNFIYEYVMHNFKDKIDLPSVASLVNMTPTSFSRFFTSRVNKSFSDFLKEIRINYACKLLHEDQVIISQIAYECGFPTLSNFNKQFKIVRGETPLAYRKKYQEISKQFN
jgi:AraC-like DNA-binding protein